VPRARVNLKATSVAGKSCSSGRARTRPTSEDDEHVALRPAENVLVHAPLDEPLEKTLLAGTDHDQVGAPPFGQANDRFRRRSNSGNEFGAKGPLGEGLPSLLELAPGMAGGIIR
jgi:hypothetical protein